MRSGCGVLAVAMLIAFLTGCDSITGSSERLRVTGTVTDVRGEPVAGAVVTLVARSFSTGAETVMATAVTDDVGGYAMTVGPAPGYARINCSILDIYVSSQGYHGAGRLGLGGIHDPDCQAGHKRIHFTLEVDWEGPSLEVLVIVGGTPTLEDRYLMDLVSWGGHQLSYMMVQHATPDRDFHGTQVLLVAPSALALPSDFREVPLGMVVLEATLWEPFGLGEGATGVAGETALEVLDPEHPIIRGAGLGPGVHAITESTSGVLSTADRVGPGAHILARAASGSGPALVLYDGGAELADGALARGRRVSFSFTPPRALNAAGELIILETLKWASGAAPAGAHGG